MTKFIYIILFQFCCLSSFASDNSMIQLDFANCEQFSIQKNDLPMMQLDLSCNNKGSSRFNLQEMGCRSVNDDDCKKMKKPMEPLSLQSSFWEGALIAHSPWSQREYNDSFNETNSLIENESFARLKILQTEAGDMYRLIFGIFPSKCYVEERVQEMSSSHLTNSEMLNPLQENSDKDDSDSFASSKACSELLEVVDLAQESN